MDLLCYALNAHLGVPDEFPYISQFVTNSQIEKCVQILIFYCKFDSGPALPKLPVAQPKEGPPILINGEDVPLLSLPSHHVIPLPSLQLNPKHFVNQFRILQTLFDLDSVELQHNGFELSRAQLFDFF